MAKDFSGQRLRWRRFSGDLRGASFRGADLRGASFRGADLTGTDFTGARLGQGGWRLRAAALVGLLAGLVAGLLAAADVLLVVTFVFEIRQYASGATTGERFGLGALDSNGWIAAAVLIGLVGAAGLAVRWGCLWRFGVTLGTGFAVALAVGLTVPAIGTEVLVLALLAFLGMTVALTVAVVVALASAMTRTAALAGALCMAVLWPIAATTVGVTARGGLAVAAAAAAFVLLGWYVYRCAVAENPQLPGLRRWILAVATWPGTDFRNAILSSADFSGARMTFARLGRAADLRCTRFRGARDLHLASVRGTILADRRVRELLVSGEGAGGDFDHADLHGAWLAGANLRGARFCDAELTGADLSRADLTDADLSRATLIGADLTGATLTGALLEGWNIDTATRLDGAAADYVYLESGPKGVRRERRPQGEGIFGPGDFATLFKRALKTVDLIFRNGIDWGAFRAAFDDLHAWYADFGDGRDCEVRVQSVENTPDGRVIIRVAVPDGADKDADYRRLTAGYEQRLAALEAERGRLAGRLEHHEELVANERRHNAVLERMIDASIGARAQPLTIHNIVQNARETDQMTGGDSIHQSGNFSGSNINVKSSLTQVSQAIGTLPGLDESGRRQLSSLLAELAEALAQAPPECAQEAAAVAALTAELIEKARAAPPNPPLLRISAEGVLKAAKSLAETAAPVLKILDQVVGLLGIH